ncbi:MAG: ABC transporter permease [Thermoplasmata archaeon]|nr:ABC transporter permease [Thermoplasmata archaeon]
MTSVAEARSPAVVDRRSHLPPTLAQITKLTRYQLRDYLRSRRFVLMMGLVGIIGFLITSIVGYYRPAGLVDSPPAFYGSLWGGGVTVVIVFAGVIFGSDAIAGEFQNKTGYFLMGLPIRRITVYVGKYAAAMIASITAVLLFAAILLANGAYYFGSRALPWEFFASFGLALVYLLALLGATFLFSSLFKTSTYATLVVAVLYLFGFPILQTLLTNLVQIEPWFVISYASGIIGNVFLNPYPAHITHGIGPAGPGSTFYNPTVPEGIAIMLVYFVATAILGLLLFEREEFT